MGMNKPLVAAAIPSRNEERSIGYVVLKSKEHVDRVVVVNDGSTDLTSEVARMAGAEVVDHKVNRGKGAGIATALRWAKRNNVDVLVLIDGDGQHDPDHIPDLVDPILKEEADVTIGSRWVHEKGLREMPIHRILGNWVLSTATSITLSKTIRDSQSGYRAFHKRTLDTFHHAMEVGFATESEMITLVDKNGFRWKEVGVTAKYDNLDSSTEGSWRHGIGVLGKVMRILRVHRPSRFFGLMSFLSLLLAAFVGAYGRIRYPEENLLPIGAIYIVVSLSIIGGFLAFSGIMLSGVNRISDRIYGIVMDIVKKAKG